MTRNSRTRILDWLKRDLEKTHENTKMTTLNKALKKYQIEKPKRKFWTWSVIKGYAYEFTKEEVKEALEISKTLKC